MDHKIYVERTTPFFRSLFKLKDPILIIEKLSTCSFKLPRVLDYSHFDYPLRSTNGEFIWWQFTIPSINSFNTNSYIRIYPIHKDVYDYLRLRIL